MKPMRTPQTTDWTARFRALTPSMASLVVMTGRTMNLMPSRKVMNTEAVFANKADAKTLNRATGIILVILGVVVMGFNALAG